MPYATRYTFTFADLTGNRYDGYIYQDGYGGAPTNITTFLGKDFCNIEYSSEEDIATPIRPMALTLNVKIDNEITPTGIFEMLAATNFQYKIKLIKGGVVVFSGYFQPIENIEFSPYKMSSANLVFTDGLTYLKSVDLPYTIAQAKDYLSYGQIIYDILALTNQAFDIYYVNSITSQSLTTLAHIDWISINRGLFLDESGTKYQNCYEVLTKIAAKFGCTIFQREGKWWMINLYESATDTRKGCTIPASVYSVPAMADVTIPTANLLTNIRSIINRGMTLKALGRLGKAALQSYYGPHWAGIRNWNYNIWTGASTSAPNSWTLDGFMAVQRNGGTGVGSDYSMYLKGYYNPSEGGTTYDFIRSGSIDVTQGDKFIPIWLLNDLQSIGGETPIGTVAYELRNTETSTDYFLKTDGTWTTTNTQLAGYDSAGVACGQQICEIPYTGTLRVRVYKSKAIVSTGQSQAIYYMEAYYCGLILIRGREKQDQESTFYKFNNVEFLSNNGVYSNVNQEPIQQVGYIGDSGTDLPYISANDEYRQVFLGVDRNSLLNNTLVVPTVASGVLGTVYSSMTKLLGFYRLRFYSSNKFLISGDFLTSDIAVGNTYSFDVLNAGIRKFVCVSLKWNVKQSIYNAVMVQCNIDVSESGWTFNIIPK